MALRPFDESDADRSRCCCSRYSLHFVPESLISNLIDGGLGLDELESRRFTHCGDPLSDREALRFRFEFDPVPDDVICGEVGHEPVPDGVTLSEDNRVSFCCNEMRLRYDSSMALRLESSSFSSEEWSASSSSTSPRESDSSLSFDRDAVAVATSSSSASSISSSSISAKGVNFDAAHSVHHKAAGNAQKTQIRKDESGPTLRLKEVEHVVIGGTL